MGQTVTDSEASRSNGHGSFGLLVFDRFHPFIDTKAVKLEPLLLIGVPCCSSKRRQRERKGDGVWVYVSGRWFLEIFLRK